MNTKQVRGSNMRYCLLYRLDRRYIYSVVCLAAEWTSTTRMYTKVKYIYLLRLQNKFTKHKSLVCVHFALCYTVCAAGVWGYLYMVRYTSIRAVCGICVHDIGLRKHKLNRVLQLNKYKYSKR